MGKVGNIRECSESSRSAGQIHQVIIQPQLEGTGAYWTGSRSTLLWVGKVGLCRECSRSSRSAGQTHQVIAGGTADHTATAGGYWRIRTGSRSTLLWVGKVGHSRVCSRLYRSAGKTHQVTAGGTADCTVTAGGYWHILDWVEVYPTLGGEGRSQ